MIVLLVILAIPFSSVLAANLLFDRLLKLEYTSHHKDWEQDGRPIGVFWMPWEPSFWSEFWDDAFISRGRSRNVCMRSWTFETPEWMRPDARALRLVFWMRVFYAVSLITLLTIFAAVLTLYWFSGNGKG
jgi:hypothetical protein